MFKILLPILYVIFKCEFDQQFFEISVFPHSDRLCLHRDFENRLWPLSELTFLKAILGEIDNRTNLIHEQNIHSTSVN